MDHSTLMIPSGPLKWGRCGWWAICCSVALLSRAANRATLHSSPALGPLWVDGALLEGQGESTTPAAGKEEHLGGVTTSGLAVEEALFRPRWLGVARDDLFGESWKRVEGGWLLRVCMTFSGDFMGDKRRATFKVHSGGY